MNSRLNYLERAKALMKANSIRAGALAVIPLSAMIAPSTQAQRDPLAIVQPDFGSSGGGFTWIGTPDQSGNGNWSRAGNWSPTGIPNDAAQQVCIPYTPSADFFNGPTLDITIMIGNLTLSNRGLINGAGFNNLTVLNSTSLTTTFGHNGEYGILSSHGGTFTLGALSNYNSNTSTLENGGFTVDNGGTIQWLDANIVNNNGFLGVDGATSHVRKQNGGASALTNLAANGGSLHFGNGFNFTTVGDFTNTGDFALSGGPSPTIFTVTGQLTNFDPNKKTLSRGSYTIDGPASFPARGLHPIEAATSAATATLRFPQADIQTLSNATITLSGPGAAITDLSGADALRNLKSIQSASFSSAGTRIITPTGGTFTNDNSTHKIESGGKFTIQGNHTSLNTGVTRISPPAVNADTSLLMTGNSLIDGGGMDFGGQPGVNTQYHSTLQVKNGIEFRGAFLTGTGTTYADMAFTSSAILSPGFSAGVFFVNARTPADAAGGTALSQAPDPGTIQPSAPQPKHSAGQLTFVGSVTMGNTTGTQMRLGGLSAGDQFDQIAQSGGTLTLGGNLLVSFIDGFENLIKNADTFDLITSNASLAGSLSNVQSGKRLATNDGKGAFIATYNGGNKVTLSQFLPPPTIVSVTKMPNQHFQILCQGFPEAAAYDLQASPDLNSANFQKIKTVGAGPGGLFLVEDDRLPLNSSQQFYRIVFPGTAAPPPALAQATFARSRLRQ